LEEAADTVGTIWTMITDGNERRKVYEQATQLYSALQQVDHDQLVDALKDVVLGELRDPIENFSKEPWYNSGFIAGYAAMKFGMNMAAASTLVKKVIDVAKGLPKLAKVPKSKVGVSSSGGANWKTPTPDKTPRKYPADKVNGRRVRGYRDAGKIIKVRAYGAEYDVPRTNTGNPDFKATPTPPNAPRVVPVAQDMPAKGTRGMDKTAFIEHMDKAFPGWKNRLEKPLSEYDLHHHQDVTPRVINGKKEQMVQLQLVLKDVHKALKHTGSAAKMNY
ncbi:MAG: hypothetical protein AAFN74_15850, partial [Myxococcota bacterium]